MDTGRLKREYVFAIVHHIQALIPPKTSSLCLRQSSNTDGKRQPYIL